MNTVQLRCFITVADTLNFTKAAAQLNMTQPAVSLQVQSLEEELNTKLLKRSTKSVELTKEGIYFLKDAKDILLIFERSRKKLAESEQIDFVSLNIGTHSQAEYAILTNILRSLKREFPTLYPNFSSIQYQFLFKYLDDGEVDVITAFHETIQDEKSRKYVEFGKVPVSAFLLPDHPLAEKKELCLEDLKQDPVILITPKECPDDLGRQFYTIVQGRTEKDIYLCDTNESALTLASSGFGIAVQPDMPTWRNPELVVIPLHEFPPLSYGAYYRSSSLKGNPVLKRFLELGEDTWPSGENSYVCREGERGKPSKLQNSPSELGN